MFWGVTLETGKRYSQRVEESYHLTNAALEPPTEGKKTSKYVSVMVEHDKSDYMVCTLEPNRNLQVHLDLMFVEGEEVTYYITGEGTVHLTGYLVGDPYDDLDEEDVEDESSEEEVEVNGPSLKNNKRKNEALESSPESTGKKTKIESKPAIKDSKVVENDKSSAKKPNINEKKNKNEKLNNINNKESDEEVDDEDDSEDDEESDGSEANDSLGLIDREAVEVDDSDGEEDEDESDDDSDDSEEIKSSPEKPKQEQKQQNTQQKPQNFQQKSPQNQNQNKQKQFGSGQKGGFGGQQNKGFGGQQNKGFGGQQDKGFGGQQNRNFGGQQKGFQQQKGQWNQSGQKNQNQRGGNQWKDRRQSGGSQGNSPNFGGKGGNFGGKQTPNFKGPQKGNFNQTPNFGQKGSQSKQNRKNWSSDKKKQNKNQRKLSGGLIVEDIVEGSGDTARDGKFVHINFVGRLTDKTMFDKSTHNKPFSFRLGRGEVIKGWDIGLKHMKVGGKRKITVPSHMAYGNRSKGLIPSNSTLEYEVELKSVT